jgi:hypothetical protein
MATMMECYPSQVFVDDEMKPLVSGRVTVYEHDTNVLASIYSLEGQDYVAMDNPVRLDEAGRLGASIFAELGVYDVKVERYNGDGTFEDFDNFEMGIDAKLDQVGRDSVKDIDALKDLDPSVSTDVVTVEEYPRRDYLWDPDAVDDEDGGVVIASDVSATGRWLLLTDCPYIKSSVYGVINGDTSNINALFNYPRVIGSMNMVTPTTIWLEPGHYALGSSYVCTKKLAIGPDTWWTGTIMVPCDIEILGKAAPLNAIGNIMFTNHNCTAHSSWYFSVNDFWHCGADTYVVDSENYFSDTRLTSPVNLSGKVVIGKGTLVSSYVNNSYFTVSSTTSIDNEFFVPSSDFVRITSQGFGDNLFRPSGSWDPGLINGGHHVQFDQTPDIDLFANAQRWVDTMLERRARLSTLVWSLMELDLQGRSCANIRLDQAQTFTSIKNAIVTNAIRVIYATSFNNVKSTVVVAGTSTSRPTLFVTDSDITVDQNYTYLDGINGFNSNVSILGPNGIDPVDTSLTLYGGTFEGYVKLNAGHADSYTLGKELAFRNVFIKNNFKWKINRIYMEGCTSACPIDLYPAAGGDGKFYYNCVMNRNTFLGAFRLWITYWWDANHHHTEIQRDAVKFNQMSITNNSFQTNDVHGIKMTMWNVKAAQPMMAQVYSSAISGYTDTGVFHYEGNTGHCPLMTPHAINNTNAWPTTYEEHTSNVDRVMWRVNTASWYLWAPDTKMIGGTYDEGAVNPMRDPRGHFYDDPSIYSYLLGNITGSEDISWTIYGYRRLSGIGTEEQMMDEDINNKFIVVLYMGNGLYVVPTYASGITQFLIPA